MTDKLIRKLRCAIYTRKSSEEGLDMEFNSLDAQRETSEAFILSQKQEGWVLVPDHYDDGGFSGGTMERPALTRLLQDIKNGLIDIVVVYKVDRLSRALVDFARIVELFDQHHVSFVSVTQQFNTTTSIGRLTLNMLLSFAQFEREVIGERIRDKVAASKRKGMWMGGVPPLGYDVTDRKLIVNEPEAEQIRHIFTRFTQLRSITLLTKELRKQGCRNKTYVTKEGREREGQLVNKSFLYKLLNNRLYLGEISHKGQPYPGLHQPIVNRDLWNLVHSTFEDSPKKKTMPHKAKTPALLKGLLKCGGCQGAMTPTHTRRKGKQYRYYMPGDVAKGKCDHCPIGNVPAGEIEDAIMQHVRALLMSPEMAAKTCKQIEKLGMTCSEPEFASTLQRLPLWEELFPAEQHRILHLLIEKAEVHPKGLDITLNIRGVHSIFNSLQGKVV